MKLIASLFFPLIIMSLFIFFGCKKEVDKQNELVAVVNTLPISEKTDTSAKSGGNITADGNSVITSRGIVLDTANAPSIETHLRITSDGTGAGVFSTTLATLSQNTDYYIRAYATNIVGTYYGNLLQFRTEGIPQCNFYAYDTSGLRPFTVNFIDQSANNPSSWLWDFGDGNTSAMQNPIHTYQNTGSYTAKLTVTNIYGSDTKIKNNYISVVPREIIYCPGSPTITDIDGNLYNTVLIGGQCWMKENLKTIKYRNGIQIEYPGDDNYAWDSNTSGAYAWYNNDVSNKDSYGALYNWYAVNNTNGLCPTGWHVPSDDEWSELIVYIKEQGFSNHPEDPFGAGNALKSCRQLNSPLGGDCNTSRHPRWESHSTHHGFDEFGFSAYPGGVRDGISGSFNNIGKRGEWLSSTESSSTTAWRWPLSSDGGWMPHGQVMKHSGYSVRCLKD
jgi:uncharacterized protein (TIGR02145 family)